MLPQTPQLELGQFVVEVNPVVRYFLADDRKRRHSRYCDQDRNQNVLDDVLARFLCMEFLELFDQLIFPF